ncbi:MAG TPA: hypothetical protein VLB44_26585 [Kofleriaceae bacterium]|nr:hypothetical protein [Kofleriaceae bacterium]
MRPINLGRLLIAAVLVVSATAHADDGVDFIADAKLLYRVAACGGTDPVEPKLAKIVESHCKAINEKLGAFQKQYFEKGRSWFDGVVPKDIPKTVVYPFGGGDLISALVAFPEATDITTISLELAGDPRRLKTLSPAAVQMSLGGLRAEIGGLISVGSNTSENLSAGQRNDLPAQVGSFLIALVAGGYEPVSMRYFTIDDAGDLHYVTQDEIDTSDKEAKIKLAKEAKAAKLDPEYKASSHLKHDWQSPNFALAFSNVEIQYRKIGDSQIRVHRHIAWNLGDAYLKKHQQLIRHLEKKGDATMLVKGASYLLWRADFSLIRGYLLDHLAWMLSDSTGIPPSYAKPAGMIQETYGRFDGAFLEGSQTSKHNEDFIQMWKAQKKRALPFRFGYVDMNKQAHLVVTRPRPK